MCFRVLLTLPYHASGPTKRIAKSLFSMVLRFFFCFLQNMQKWAYSLNLSSLRLRYRLAFSAVTVSVMIFISSSLPSVDKGKHACQRVFPALFALFALAGASPPAAQKPKITRRSIAGRCGQFCRSRNVFRQGKARREYCRIVKGLDAVWAHFCPAKPCLPSSIDGTVCNQIRKPTVQTRPRTALSMHSASAGSQSRVFIICTSGFVPRSVMPVSIWLICAAPTSVIAASRSCVRFFR